MNRTIFKYAVKKILFLLPVCLLYSHITTISLHISDMYGHRMCFVFPSPSDSVTPAGCSTI